MIGAGGVALAALLVVGLIQLTRSSPVPASGPSRLTLSEMRASLGGSPAPLAALHAQASEILPGGLPALRSRLASLHGRPIVINKWASWCQPCRAEFGAFQRASVAEGREVAFLGIDSGDSSHADAVSFLRSFPVSYPSYYDANGQAGAAITDSTFTPVTVFYDRAGRQYIHQGPYASAARLERDVRRYALGA
ncbi:MAG: TlpA family protein disulfide reductase [Solirubrobacterales bacterium]|nr:TlpA family protein disulfide reductase [Solirubrobacterales bacterium]MCW3025280.1 TlpA family protein disulfide reductase [Solirubrobacterales bacterium]